MMIKCRECGTEISSKSQNCINCGAPTSYSLKQVEDNQDIEAKPNTIQNDKQNQRSIHRSKLFRTTLTGILVVAIIIVAIFINNNDTANKSFEDKAVANNQIANSTKEGIEDSSSTGPAIVTSSSDASQPEASQSVNNMDINAIESNYKLTDFIGKTYGELLSMIGGENTKPYPFEATNEICIDYGDASNNGITFGFDNFNGAQEVNKDIYIRSITATGDWTIDSDINLGMSIKEIENIKGISPEINSDEQGAEWIDITLDNGSKVSLYLDGNDITYVFSFVDNKKFVY